MKNDQKFIDEILGEDFMQQAIGELGLQEVPKDIQGDLLSNIGENILKRVTLELLTALPVEERDTFEQMIGSGNGAGLREFLEKHIPNLERFVREHAEREFEATKTAIVMEKQGI
jgi:hypothetical protein